jgi:ATP-dependent Clp protease, protease subunit
MDKNEQNTQNAFEEMEVVQPSKYTTSYISLANNRIIFLTEEFTKNTASEMTALLFHYDNESHDDIHIYISSQGGDASALANIIDVMEVIKSPITTICMGRCYSAGAFLLMAGQKRLAFRHSEIMMHGAQLMFPYPGKEHTIDSTDYAKFVDRFNDRILGIAVKATGKKLSEIKKDCATDFYMSAEEAKKYGLIDEIIG